MDLSWILNILIQDMHVKMSSAKRRLFALVSMC